MSFTNALDYLVSCLYPRDHNLFETCSEDDMGIASSGFGLLACSLVAFWGSLGLFEQFSSNS